MKVNSFEVPELRMVPTALEILEEIYKVKHKERVGSKDMAIIWGYKYGTESYFYRKLKALQSYGLVEGQGNYQVSELGEQILYPKTDDVRGFSRTKAIMNVKLWKEIWRKHGKTPRQSNFWTVLNDIAKIPPDKAKSLQDKIYKWYIEDMAHVVDRFIEQESLESGQGKDLRSTNTNEEQMQQLVPPQISNQTNESIQFGKVSLSLPKKDLKNQWKKLQKYMEIYLEDYVEENNLK